MDEAAPLGRGCSAGRVGVAASRADDGEPGDHVRKVHLGITVALGSGSLVAEFGLNSQLSPTVCDWCDHGARLSRSSRNGTNAWLPRTGPNTFAS